MENLILSSCFLRMLSIIMILLESPTHKTAKLLINDLSAAECMKHNLDYITSSVINMIG